MCEVMSKEDLIFGNHRSHSHYIAKGGSLKRLLAEIYGKETGCCKGIGGSMHIMDLDVGFVVATPIVGSSIPVAMGAAFANQMKGNNLVTVLFLGDGAVEEGVFHETINLAILKNVPIIFFCENNLYSVYTHLKHRQPNRSIAGLAKAHGAESVSIDGNNILEVYTESQKAYNHVREGLGPYFIEASTYRWREHCGVYYDNNIGYRTEEEFQDWKKNCPVATFEKKILSENIATVTELEEIRKEVEKEIDESVVFAKESPFLEPEKVKEFIYAN
jgi:pyruvate dehydrogenase E1 component alpha subunit